MDDKFMELKSLSVQDMLEDQRPKTSRLLTSRGVRQPGPSPFASTNNGFLGNSVERSTFKPSGTSVEDFGGNKPKTAGRVRSSWGARPGTSIGNNFRPGTSSVLKMSDEIDYIPDLSELEEEDFATSIAAAPRAEAQRITSLSELDAELNSRRAFSVVRNVDLRKLTRFMCPEKDLIENQLVRAPGYLAEDPDDNLEEIKNYMYDALFTNISTAFDEKQNERGSSAGGPWQDDELDEDDS